MTNIADEARTEEPLRIWWNKNLHGKISPMKLAAHAAHAALHAYGIEYTHPIVVLSAGKSKIEAMPITIHDEGRTELAPGTLTTGVERSWQASCTVEQRDPREFAHIECDCVPDMGPSHCHLCNERTGRPTPWSECSSHKAGVSK